MRFDTLTTVLRRALVVGAAVGLGVGLVTGLVGFAVAGPAGLASGLVGAAMTVLFLGVTAVGILVAGRITKGDGVGPFAVLMLAWFVKLAVFVAAMVVLRNQPWVVPGVLLVAVIGTVASSLLVDAFVVGRARIPVTDRI